MSLAFLTKPIGGSKKGAQPDESKSSRQRRGPDSGPIRGGASNVNVGAVPRVDLMPPEIRLKRSQLRIRRSLRLVLFGVLAVVIAGCIGAWTLGTVARTSLSAAQAEQQQLTAQQATFSNVTTIKSSIALIKAAQKVGDSTEIDWNAYLGQLQTTLPAGVSFSTVTVNTTTPVTALQQSTTPLEGSRVATILFTVQSNSIPSIPTLLNNLKTLPGFVDATPGDVTSTTADGTALSYTSTITMHINTQAFANRFDKAAAAANAKAIAAQKGN